MYRHFPSKRAIYAELFSFCDGAIFSKCSELKKSDIESKEKLNIMDNQTKVLMTRDDVMKALTSDDDTIIDID